MADEPTIESLTTELRGVNAQLALRDSANSKSAGEAKEFRQRAEQLEKELGTATKAREKAETDSAEKVKAAEGKLTEVQTASQQRVLRAEMKVAAKTAGANDPADLIALIPLDQVKLDEKGEPTNLEELIEGVKKAKPYLFGVTGSGSTYKAPKPGDAKPFDARTASPEEYAARKAELTNSRR